MPTQITVAGACLIVAFATGFWLSRRGRPYGALLLTLHKLVALAAIALLGLAAYARGRALPLAIGAGAFFLAAIVSGGLVSARPVSRWVLWVHKLAPWLAVVLGMVRVVVGRA